MRILSFMVLWAAAATLFAQESCQPDWKQQLIQLGYSSEACNHIFLHSHYRDEVSGIWHGYLQYRYRGIWLFPDQLTLHFCGDSLCYVSGSLQKDQVDQCRNLKFLLNAHDILFAHLHLEGKLTAYRLPLATRQSSFAEFAKAELQAFPDDDYQYRQIYYKTPEALIPAYEVYWRHIPTGEWTRTIWNAANGALVEKQPVWNSCDFSHTSFYRTSLFCVEPTDVSVTDCYRVFALPVESPAHGTRSLQCHPAAKAPNASPLAWHNDGTAQYTVSKGNNADAYEDSDNDNQPTGGNAARANGGADRHFDFSLNHALPPLANKNASITNLFYWTNIMHDVWYQYGFTEQAGNFQANNFGKGGVANDYVVAEAIDNLSYARNNANFGTGPDGVTGQMQIYVWKLPIYDTLVVNQPPQLGKMVYVAGGIGERVLFPLTGSLVLANDGSNHPSCGCNAYQNAQAVNGNIALVDRGVCGFATKIIRAQNAGAVAILVCNNEPYEPFVIGGISNNIAIPVMMISQSDCQRIKVHLAQGVNITCMPSSALKFSSGGRTMLFSRASYGSVIPNGTGQIAMVQDGIGDVHDACQILINGSELSGKIAMIHDRNCDVSYKVYQAQQRGAAAAIICKMEPGLPDSIGGGAYTQNIAIPVIKLSKQDCDYIKLNLPLQGTFSNATPQLVDGAFDAGVVCHEYGHGISHRLTGGPNNTSCLFNAEQMGEGWSDYFGLAMTMKPTDHAYLARGIGTYGSGQPNHGVGVRPYPYSVSLSVNPASYAMLPDELHISQPHGIGFIWCSMLWDLHWAMVARYGLEADWYNVASGKGNIKAAQLIMEGMKLQPCSPGFVDARNAIIQADALLFGGVNACLIWNVFARRGLGYSARQGNPNNRFDGTAAYDLPPGCLLMSEAQLFNNSFLAEFQLSISPILQLNRTVLLTMIWDTHLPAKRIWWERRVAGKPNFLSEVEPKELAAGFTQVEDVPESFDGNLLYRLHAEMKSGIVYRSDWAKLTLNRDQEWTVVPNPAMDHVTISGPDYEGEVELYLLNAWRQPLESQNLHLRKGDRLRCNVGALPAGEYCILLRFGGRAAVLKFVKL